LFVARPAHLRTRQNHCGLRVLFRTGAGNFFPAGVDPDTASKEIIGQTLSVFGLEALVGEKLAYVTSTRRLLLDGTYAFLPAGRLVLELLESLTPDPETLAACQAAKNAGYALALDDYHRPPSSPRSSAVRRDQSRLPHRRPRTRDASSLNATSRPACALLAEKVETLEDFTEALALGYTYYQGYFFCRPKS